MNNSHVAQQVQKVDISPEARKILKKITENIKCVFEGAVKEFSENLNQTESLEILMWYCDIIYFQVNDSRFKQYPENISALISFDIITGEFYSGERKHKVARRHWGEFLRKIERSHKRTG